MTIQPPPSQLLSQLRASLVTAQGANQGQLPLNQSTLSSTSGADLLTLFNDQFQISSFTMTNDINIHQVIGNLLVVSGQGNISSKNVTLSLIFTDNSNDINIEALFSASLSADLVAAFPSLPTQFFQGITDLDTNPVVNFPAGLPTNVGFTNASYGVQGYYYPNQGYIVSYLVPQIQGLVSASGQNMRVLSVELPTDTSGWRLMSPNPNT